MKTGNTPRRLRRPWPHHLASMEPGHEDREYTGVVVRLETVLIASMEPGHEDREYAAFTKASRACAVPQWSPVMKTGNTRHHRRHPGRPRPASMEPGHEDREYKVGRVWDAPRERPQWSPVMKTGNTGAGPARSAQATCASMEPGHEDREYKALNDARRAQHGSLNGARS